MWYEAELDRQLRDCRMFMEYIINEILFSDDIDIERKMDHVGEYNRFENKYWEAKKELRE